MKSLLAPYVQIKVGFLIRVFLAISTIFLDKILNPKFTDIDYQVFSDAATLVTKGESPYLRETYRYTPILAYIMTPNIYIPIFGKLLFCTVDYLMCLIFLKMYEYYGFSIHTNKRLQWILALGWSLNPIAIVISSRGNAESIITFLVLASLYFSLCTNELALSAIIFGLSVHFKVYPILYGPLFLFAIQQDLFPLFSKKRLKFFFISSGVFFGLMGLFYSLYGEKFLHETYIYHIGRQDHRHNFSLYWLSIYFNLCSTSVSSFPFYGVLLFIPQIIMLGYTTWKFRLDTTTGIFVITFLFVTFNKVMTVQYFVWWIALLPLTLPKVDNLSKILFPCVLWFLALGHWLFWAYLLEVQGQNTYLQIFIAAVLFFCSQMYLLVSILKRIYPKAQQSVKKPKTD